MKRRPTTFVCRGAFTLVFLTAALSWMPVASGQTVKAGVFEFTLGVTAGATYSDNKNTSETNPRGDLELSLGPTVSGGIVLAPQLPGGEQLRLLLSASFSLTYSLEEGVRKEFSSPIDVSVLLPFRVGQWYCSAGDSFSFRNDPVETTFGFGRTEAPIYENSAIITATRLYGRLGTTYALQRSDKFAPDDIDLEETVHTFSFTPSFYFRENYSVFLRNTAAMTELGDPERRDQRGWSTELGISGQITPSLSGTMSMGWSHSTLEATATNGVDNVDGISSSIALSYTNPLRPNTTHSISFFRSPGVTATLKESDIQEIIGVTYSIAHRLNRYVTIAPTVSWQNTKDITPTGGTGENVDIISVGLGTSRAFTRHLSGSLNYRYQTRDSNLVGQSYDVNEVTLTFVYTF